MTDAALRRLLLCCRLGQSLKPLSQQEYEELLLALHYYTDGVLNGQTLRELGYAPDFIRRVMELLDRKEQAAHYLKGACHIQIVHPEEPCFPQALLRMENQCPPLLFCKGELSLLCKESVSLVGSRDIRPLNRSFAQAIGRKAALEGFVLVSGDARGADTAAQNACLQAGGSVIAFVPDDLQKYPLKENVLYISDEGYDCAFSAARALRRNHYIHAMGKLCFAAQCSKEGGGTWQGALDNLRHRRTGLFVFDDGSKDAEALIALGAKPLTAPPSRLSDLMPD